MKDHVLVRWCLCIISPTAFSTSKANFQFSTATNQEKRSTLAETTWKMTIKMYTLDLQLPTLQRSKTKPFFCCGETVPNRKWFYPQATMPFDFDCKSLQLQAEQKTQILLLGRPRLGLYFQSDMRSYWQSESYGSQRKGRRGGGGACCSTDYLTWFINVCFWFPGIHWLHCIDDIIQARG